MLVALSVRAVSFALALAAVLGACDPDTEVAGCELPSNVSPELSSVIPVDVFSPAAFTAEESRPWFDIFSWQTFIALNGGATGTETPVWLSYKDAEALFPDSGAPVPWGDPAPPVACPGTPPGQAVFTMASKGGSLLDDEDESFSYPLIDQDGNFVYFEVRYNEPMYEWIRTEGWFTKAGQSPPLTLPASVDPDTTRPIGPGNTGTVGSMMIKAAWKVLAGDDDASRFFTQEASVYEPTSGTCQTETVGLVGFHIAQKTQQFGPWVWSTFEQVDNVPDGTPGQSGTYSFNNGTDDPPTGGDGFANQPKYKAEVYERDTVAAPGPVQVDRVNSIPTTPGCSTQYLNSYYRDEIVDGTVWANYQLVMTQWPTNSAGFGVKGAIDSTGSALYTYPSGAGTPFPDSGAVNTTMETYFQTQDLALPAGGNSCMQCHYGASSTDFSFTLLNRPRTN